VAVMAAVTPVAMAVTPVAMDRVRLAGLVEVGEAAETMRRASTLRRDLSRASPRHSRRCESRVDRPAARRRAKANLWSVEH
jgi:hypothetical protein